MSSISPRCLHNRVELRLTTLPHVRARVTRVNAWMRVAGRRLRGGVHGDDGFPVATLERGQHPGPRGQRRCREHAEGGGSVSSEVDLVHFVLHPREENRDRERGGTEEWLRWPKGGRRSSLINTTATRMTARSPLNSLFVFAG